MQREVLNLAASQQLRCGDSVPETDVLLENPALRQVQVEEAIASLRQKDCLDVIRGRIDVTPTGLLICSRRLAVITFAERWLKYFQGQVERRRSRFDRFTWPELEAAGVATSNQYHLARTVIAQFGLYTGMSSVASDMKDASTSYWGVSPEQGVDLRSAKGAEDLYRRAQSLRRTRVEQRAWGRVSPMQGRQAETERWPLPRYDPEVQPWAPASDTITRPVVRGKARRVVSSVNVVAVVATSV
ncbi:MAG: hypothetical protein IPI67_26715 [Myxococcales bacterium]|nr:hypothetical protein [Myxococcales bacterium]